MDHDTALPPAAETHLPVESRLAPPPVHATDHRHEDQPRGIASAVWRQRWIILGCVVSGLGAAALITSLLPRTFESHVTVLAHFTSSKQTPGAFAVLEREGRAGTADTEMQLMQSRSVIAPVIDRLDLHVILEGKQESLRPSRIFTDFSASRQAAPAVYKISSRAGRRFTITDVAAGTPVAHGTSGESVAFAGLSFRLPENPGSTPFTLVVHPFGQTVASVQERIGVEQIARDGSLIKLTCAGGSPEQARDLCHEVSQAYMRLRSEMHAEQASTAADFLREQSERIRLRLAVAEESLAVYSRQHGVVALDTRATMEVQQLGSRRAQRDRLAAEHRSLGQLLAGITEDRNDAREYRDIATFPALAGNRAVSELMSSLVQLENERSDLALRRTERNPDLAAVDARIADIEAELLGVARSYRQALELQITSLDRTLAESRDRLQVIPTQQVTLARLQRQVDLLERLYSDLQTRLREAEIAEAVDLPSVQIVDAAVLPLEPTSPHAAANLALGLILGGGLGLVLAFWRELTDTRLREPAEVSAQTKLPILGLIPGLDSAGPILPVLRSVEGSGGTGTVVPLRSRQEELLADVFGGIAADLRFLARGREGRPLRSVVITSAMRGEGKTLVACNLSIAAAATGQRTLLIDADLRANGVSAFFKLPLDLPGVSDVLLGRSTLQSVWQRMHVQARGGLWVAPAGGFTHEAAGQLGPPAIRELIDNPGSEFDLIVIDTPPVSVITDAAPVASAIDAVVVVVRGGVADRAALSFALERLRRAGARIAGVVLNDFEVPAAYSSYYGGARSNAG